MKKCKSVRSLLFLLERGVPATLVVHGSKYPVETTGVWGYCPSCGDSVSLNIAGERISLCSWDTYERIRDHLTVVPCPCPKED